MTAFIVRRLLATIPVMVVVATFVFLLLRLTPGDPAALIAGDDATSAQIENIRQQLGLDRLHRLLNGCLLRHRASTLRWNRFQRLLPL